MASAQTRPFHTIDEYLALERQSEERHQYVDGQIYAMAGESPEHSTICCNITAILVPQLRGRGCRTFSPNMKIRSGPLQRDSRRGFFSYADLSVVCGEPRFHDEHRDVLLNATLLIEVLSPSTEAFDRGEKFQRYRAHLESLCDYVFISSDKPLAEHFRRQPGGSWLYCAVEGLDGRLGLPSVGAGLALGEVYEGVKFPDQD
jgi:Uma2 family endonuclease